MPRAAPSDAVLLNLLRSIENAEAEPPSLMREVVLPRPADAVMGRNVLGTGISTGMVATRLPRMSAVSSGSTRLPQMSAAMSAAPPTGAIMAAPTGLARALSCGTARHGALEPLEPPRLAPTAPPAPSRTVLQQRVAGRCRTARARVATPAAIGGTRGRAGGRCLAAFLRARLDAFLNAGDRTRMQSCNGRTRARRTRWPGALHVAEHASTHHDAHPTRGAAAAGSGGCAVVGTSSGEHGGENIAGDEATGTRRGGCAVVGTSGGSAVEGVVLSSRE